MVAQSALAVGFDELTVEADLTVVIPERLKDPELTEHARKILVPPPVASANEIVAMSGGMFYAQETPVVLQFSSQASHLRKT